jgi:hypothetical protein
LERSVFLYVFSNAKISIMHYSGYLKIPAKAIYEDLRKRFEGQGRKARTNGQNQMIQLNLCFTGLKRVRFFVGNRWESDLSGFGNLTGLSKTIYLPSSENQQFTKKVNWVGKKVSEFTFEVGGVLPKYPPPTWEVPLIRKKLKSDLSTTGI